ncbi:MAG: DNA recombination protein RmuC [Clostridia bacterium]|nr:DNA recombination protein RmuC [Clostridia bacterium]
MELMLLTALVAVLLIINVIILILVLKKNNKKEYSDLLSAQEKNGEKIAASLRGVSSAIGDEFSRSRMENAQYQAAQRQDVSNSLSAMSEKLEKMTKENYEINAKMTAAIAQSLTQIRTENSEKLEQIRLTVDEKLNETLTKRLDSSFKTVSEQLENVYKSLGEMKVLSSGVTENVTSLNRILTNVKARGTWAEVQLEGLLEQTIPTMFVKNYSPNSTREVVEFAVKIPSGDDKSSFTYLPIDSKFPVEDYIRLCSAADSGDSAGVEVARKALEARVIAQAKDVKKYINEPATTPFAIMYLATEGLYGEIIGSKNGIAERCQNEFHVMIAGPSTITALLNSLSVGFRAMAINEKAKEIRKLLAAAKTQYEKFGIVLEKARKKIDEAGKTLDDAQTRNEQIQKKLRSVEEIEQDEAQKLLEIE